jgi:EAL domain-containing protein (putative c-di-GMP-specific phosphodiesterase class I)/DNA-binding response OmpR family regulator
LTGGGGSEQDPPESIRILVVDDDSLVRDLLSETLTRAGFQVVTAASGERGIEALSQDYFGLMLLDVRMPGGMTGIDVLRQIRASKQTEALPVILLTGESDVASRVEGLTLGATDYVLKPFEMEELLARINTHLRARAVWQQQLEERLQARGRVVRALAATVARQTTNERATAIVETLCDLPGIEGAAIVWLSPEGGAIPIAAAGPDLRLSAAAPLSSQVATYLITRGRLGPWLEGRGGPDPQLVDRHMAWAPIGLAAEPDAILGLAATKSASPADLAQMLGAAVDYAAVATGVLGQELRGLGEERSSRVYLESVIQDRQFTPYYQPIVDLPSERVIGYEALTRFADGAPPDRRFAQATRLGLGVDLEAATITAAVGDAARLPSGGWLSINVSPAMIRAADLLAQSLADADREVVLEMTEHDPVDDYEELLAALQSLPRQHRLSIDDAGSGFASLRHILRLHPTFVKLDGSWAHTIETDPARQALVAGLVRFATGTSAELIAEGIETSIQNEVLKDLGVTLGQGYFLGRPQQAPSVF